MRTTALLIFLGGLAISLFGILSQILSWIDPIYSSASGPLLMALGFALFLRAQSRPKKVHDEPDILDSDL